MEVILQGFSLPVINSVSDFQTSILCKLALKQTALVTLGSSFQHYDVWDCLGN